MVSRNEFTTLDEVLMKLSQCLMFFGFSFQLLMNCSNGNKI